MQNGGASPGSRPRSFPIDLTRMSELERRIKDPPAMRNSCCIFRVPPSLSEINEKAYQPHIVSIGPYYHGDPRFKMIQDHKRRYLGDLLARTESHQLTRVSIRDLFEAISPMEESIRESYSEALNIDSHEFIELIVLDGCFIIELLCKVGMHARAERDEPLFNMAWVLPFLMRDLLRLENQIPLFVLKALFDLCVGNFNTINTSTGSTTTTNTDNSNSDNTLVKLALGFFNYMVQRPVQVLEKYYDYEGKHLLDLFRQTYLPPSQEVLGLPSRVQHLIPSVSNLHYAGVKFEPRMTESFLDIEFKNAVLKIPTLTIDDFTSSLLLNFVAYEQCYGYCSKHITTYVTFMGCLINTPTDARLLSDLKIVENYFGTDDEFTRFFNNVGKDVVFDIQRSYLSKVFEEVTEYYQKSWHVQWAAFKHAYFRNPWSLISALAGMVLLILTSFFAVYAYFRPPKNNK